MARWTGSWLGLPPEGAGSVASLGRRSAAFAVDAIGSALVAGAFTAPAAPRSWSLLVFVIEYVLFTSLFGQTPGMRLLRLRVIRLDTGRPLGAMRAVVRTVLLVLLVPALITDRDGRGLHDKVAQVVVVNS